jgi:hypothetical protein
MTLSTIRTVLTAAVMVTAGLALAGGAPLAVSVPGQVNATPSLAASGRVVALAWGATKDQGSTTVQVAVSRDSGRTFGAPVRVSDDRSAANLAAEQPPRVTLAPRAGREPSIVVVWTSKAASGTRLMVARSENGGKTFSPPAVLRASEASGNRGWESLTTDRQGRVLALWLDHRELASPGGAAHVHGAHAVAAGASDGAERAQRSKLFFASLEDPAGAREITGGVCYCCKTALAAGANGGIYAAWRHVYPGNLRDIAFAMSRDGGRTFGPPVRISEDKWQIEGCPENGPALAVDAAGRIHVVWPTLVREAGRETLALYYSTSTDGRAFSTRLRIPTKGAAYHPQLALTAAGELFVAWDELASGTRRVRFARGRSAAKGMVFDPVASAAASEGGFPSVAVTANGIVAAWAARAGSATHIAVERWE